MFEWVLGVVIGIVLLGFVGWIPALIGYVVGCLVAILAGYDGVEDITPSGLVGGLLAIIVIGLPVSI